MDQKCPASEPARQGTSRGHALANGWAVGSSVAAPFTSRLAAGGLSNQCLKQRSDLGVNCMSPSFANPARCQFAGEAAKGILAGAEGTPQAGTAAHPAGCC